MKTLTFLLLCLPFFTHGATGLEEGLILRQEMNFLEEVSARSPQLEVQEKAERSLDVSNDLSLESTYFGENQDGVRTRSSAPRRRTP